MKKLAIAAVLAGTFGLAAPALAGPGQCYDHYGRPVGPVYDTDHPNYGFINSVIRNGGSCTGVQSGYNPYRSRGYRHDYDRPHYNYNRYDDDDRRQRRRQDRDDARRHYQNLHPKNLAPGLQHRQPGAMAPNDSR
jgi:hypothetical protein